MRRLSLIAFAGLAAGCSALVSLEGLAGTPGGDIDASAEPDAGFDVALPVGDGSVLDAAGDVADGGDPELAPGGGFENIAAAGCGAWGSTKVIDPDTRAHTGSRSCRVCSDTGDVFFYPLTASINSPPEGSAFRGEAWVRAAAEDGAVGAIVFYFTPTFGDGGETRVEGSGISPAQAWERVQLTYSVGVDVGRIYFGLHGNPHNCYLIDDVSVVRVQ